MTNPAHLLWRAYGQPDTQHGPPDETPGRCWLCGCATARSYARKTYRKPTFADDHLAAQPGSERLCPACAWGLDAYRTLRAKAIITNGVVLHELKRSEIRDVLLGDLPDAPFIVLIPTSFQKHLFYRARPGLSHARYPVVFETDLIDVSARRLHRVVAQVETLRGLGHTLGEIESGKLRYPTLRKHGQAGYALEVNAHLDAERGLPLFDLALHISHDPRKEA